MRRLLPLMLVVGIDVDYRTSWWLCSAQLGVVHLRYFYKAILSHTKSKSLDIYLENLESVYLSSITTGGEVQRCLNSSLLSVLRFFLIFQ